MIQNFVKSSLSYSCLAVLYCLVLFCGCSTEKYKAEADKQTYGIIDRVWDDEYGQKVNYKISDVPPDENDLTIEPNVPIAGMITLPEAVAIATAQNREYQRQKEQLYLSALDLTGVEHDYAMQWFGTIDFTYYKNRETSQKHLSKQKTLPDGTERTVFSITKQQESTEERLGWPSELGFNQLLADGTQIGVSIAMDWGRFLTGDPRESLTSVLAATATKPLLRGAGKKIAFERLTQAQRNVLYQVRSFNRYRKTFVVSIVNDYCRVLQRLDEVKNAVSNYERRGQSKERLQMEAEAGRRNRFEVDQAVQDWLRARDNLVSTRERYQQTLDEFKITLAVPVDSNVYLDPNALQQLREVGIIEVPYSSAEAVDTALLCRLDLANSADNVDDAIRKVMVAEDNLGAELNLVASTDVHSTGQTRVGRLPFHLGDYTLGLQADLPLDRLAERNAYRESLITLTQAQRQFDIDRDNIALDVRQAYRQLSETAERYKIQKNSLDLAEKRVESTTMLIEEGRVSTRDLLEAQDALLEAQNNLTAALVDHIVAKLSFYRDIGVLQVKPDGMWQENQ
jgi:outer membrane protein TolC